MLLSQLPLNPALLQALPANIIRASEIQQRVIADAMTGKDILALAPTGSGKTLAFGLPLLNQLQPQAAHLQGLIIAPTRELAQQIYQQLQPLADSLQLRGALLIGAESQSQQIEALTSGAHFAVATLGRLLDLAQQHLANLNQLQYLILDEADRLLDMGFWPALTQLLALIPQQRRTWLFSATMNDALRPLVERLLTQPQVITVRSTPQQQHAIDERIYLVNKGSKAQALIALLQQHPAIPTLVFVSAKDNVNSITKKLIKAGFNAIALHGDKQQAERRQALADFCSGNKHVLVASDILARGIDIADLPLVINLDLPSHPTTYVHRIGRTGRAGATGLAISLCCHGESDYLTAIRQLTKRPLPLQNLAGFNVTDEPAKSGAKRAPRDKQANRRSLNKHSIKDFKSKSSR